MDARDEHGPTNPADVIVLRGVRELWEVVDPMPAELVEAVAFAFELWDAETEILRAAEHRELAAAKGDENTRLITFDGSSLTLMINITPVGDEVVRLDGWMTPAAAHRIELRTQQSPREVVADDRGRFAFDLVRRGMVQLVVHTNGTASTPSIVL